MAVVVIDFNFTKRIIQISYHREKITKYSLDNESAVLWERKTGHYNSRDMNTDVLQNDTSK